VGPDETVRVHSSASWLDGLFVSFPLIVVLVAAFFFYSGCVTPTLFVLFASVFALLSARCRYLCSFFKVPIRFLSLFCYLNPVFYYPQFIAQSVWVLPPFPFTPPLPGLVLSYLLHPVLDRRATAYCTYVFSEV